jgi:hypothetical protein
MCMDGVSHLVLSDARIQRKMANPILDIVHKQVVMTLYSLEANHQLQEYRQMLPLYLSMDWPKCAEIIDAIELAGLITRSGERIALTYHIEAEQDVGCGCHG